MSKQSYYAMDVERIDATIKRRQDLYQQWLAMADFLIARMGMTPNDSHLHRTLQREAFARYVGWIEDPRESNSTEPSK
jgi:hypothetical protein